jgi:hypothetical protein
MAVKHQKSLMSHIRRALFSLNSDKLSGRKAMFGRVIQGCYEGPQLFHLPVLLYSFHPLGCKMASLPLRVMLPGMEAEEGQRAKGLKICYALSFPFLDAQH